MRKHLLAITLFGVLSVAVGCDSPEGIIPEKKMVSIVRDMFLLDAYISRDPEICMSADSLSVYEPLIEKHGLSVAEFNRSIHFYLTDSRSYIKIMKSVKHQLDKERDEQSSKPLDEEAVQVKRHIYENRDSSAVMDSVTVIPAEDTITGDKPLRPSGKRMSRKDLKALEKKLK